jgi:hypothetical protein
MYIIITFNSDIYFGLADTGQGDLDGNTTTDKLTSFFDRNALKVLFQKI